jgi:hypothetical protein
MNTKIITITPEMAETMLKTSRGNFRYASNKIVDTAIVKKYAADMKNGKWMLNPHGIVFNDSGELIDGHHRLNAVIESGVPTIFSITFGAPNECVEVIDSGVARNPHFMLAHTKNINKAAASKRGWSTARMHFLYVYSGSRKSVKSIPSSEYHEFIIENADEIETAIRCAEHCDNKIRITINAACFYAALSALKCGIDRNIVNDFFKITTTGLYERQDQNTAVNFRNELQKANQSRDSAYWQWICNYAQTCLYDFSQHRSRVKKYLNPTPVFTEMWFEKLGIKSKE